MNFRRGPLRGGVLSLVAALACAVAALVCLRLSWWVVFQARIGPVVGVLSDGRGVHTGDFIGVAYAALGLGLVAAAAVLWDEATRKLRLADMRR